MKNLKNNKQYKFFEVTFSVFKKNEEFRKSSKMIVLIEFDKNLSEEQALTNFFVNHETLIKEYRKNNKVKKGDRVTISGRTMFKNHEVFMLKIS